MYDQVREDYETVRNMIGESGYESLSGHQGVHVQTRPKGPGHGSTSRAFYVRMKSLKLMLDL